MLINSFKEKVEEYKLVREELKTSSISFRFIIFLSLSTMLATLGLVLDNTSVLVGSMLVAPLMSVVVALGVGLALFNTQLIKTSMYSLIVGSVISILLSALLLLVIPESFETLAIVNRFQPSLPIFLVSVISGFAAGLILIWKKEVQVAAGASIATTLLPPLAATGMAISIFNYQLALHTTYMYILNLIGVIIGSILSFYLTGPAKKQEQ